MILLPRWIKLGLVSASLTAVPLQNALAFGAQWRPAMPIQPVQPIPPTPPLRPIAPIAPIAVTDPRFRPAGMARQMAMPAQRFAPVAAPARSWARPMPQQASVPTFARQYAWRPATQRWMPRTQASVQRPQQYRLVRRVVRPAPQPMPQMMRPMMAPGSWRPVQTINTPQGRYALRPVAVRGMFRPVPRYGYMPRPASPQGYRPVARMMPVMQTHQMPYAVTNRRTQMSPYAMQPWSYPRQYPQQWRQAKPYAARQRPTAAAMPQYQYRGSSAVPFSIMPQNTTRAKGAAGLPQWMSTSPSILACGNCDS